MTVHHHLLQDRWGNVMQISCISWRDESSGSNARGGGLSLLALCNKSELSLLLQSVSRLSPVPLLLLMNDPWFATANSRFAQSVHLGAASECQEGHEKKQAGCPPPLLLLDDSFSQIVHPAMLICRLASKVP